MKLRAHHLLCLHGFRGEGYSLEFVANMQAIHERLRTSPDQEVEVLASPDGICAACPHLVGGACTRGEGEVSVTRKDFAVLKRLGLAAGDELSFRLLLDRVIREFGSGDIEDTCASCPWFPLGWCADGLRRHSMME